MFCKDNTGFKRILYLSKLNIENQSIIQQRCVETTTESSHPFAFQPLLLDSFTFERTLGLVHHHVLSSMVHYVIGHSKNLIVWRGGNASEVHRIPTNIFKIYLTLSNP